MERRAGSHTDPGAAGQESLRLARGMAQSVISAGNAFSPNAQGGIVRSNPTDLQSTFRVIRDSGRNLAKLILRLHSVMEDLVSSLQDWEGEGDDDDEAFDDAY